MRRLLGLALLLSLAAAPTAWAERVGPPANDALLTLAPDGSALVGIVRGGDFLLASRTSGSWQEQRIGALPAGTPLLRGLAVAPDGPVALVQDAEGHWLGLVRGGRYRDIARIPGALLGPAGLTLDRAGRPVIAYALWRRSRKTFLRLVRTTARGALVTRGVTRLGFPDSVVPPSAAPLVMPGGQIRVVQTYGSGTSVAAIEWRPSGSTWTGQFLQSAAFDAPVGAAAGLATADGTVYAAWTDLYSRFGASLVVLARHGKPVSSTLVFQHALFAGLALAPEGPEVAANDWIDLADGPVWLGRIAGAASVALDGVVDGFAVAADGRRLVLLSRPDGLELDVSPGPLTTTVSLTRTDAPGGTSLSGTVTGLSSGNVALYRERTAGARELVALAPVQPDGSFTAVDPAPAEGTVYRAVYTDPATGLPYAAFPAG